MVSQPTNRQADRLRQQNIYFLVDVFGVVPIGYLRSGNLIAIRIHGGQNMDACGVDEPLNSLIAQQILRAQILSQVYQQLPAKNLVSMHVPN